MATPEKWPAPGAIARHHTRHSATRQPRTRRNSPEKANAIRDTHRLQHNTGTLDTMGTPTAAQIHHYDQVHAQLSATLDAMVLANADMRTDGKPREAVAAATAHFLLHDVSRATCAELCAIAIERLTEGPETILDDPPQEIMPQ